MVFALFPLNNFQVAPDHFEIGALLVVSGGIKWKKYLDLSLRGTFLKLFMNKFVLKFA